MTRLWSVNLMWWRKEEVLHSEKIGRGQVSCTVNGGWRPHRILGKENACVRGSTRKENKGAVLGSGSLLLCIAAGSNY